MKKLLSIAALALATILLLGACSPAAPEEPAAPTLPEVDAPIEATDAPAADPTTEPDPTAEPAPAADDYASLLLTEGTLTIGTSPDYPPYESLEGGELVGFDIELMEAVAASMGLTVTWSQMAFDTILVAVPAGQVDIGVSAFTYDEDRAQSMLFNTVSYLPSAQVAFVLEESEIQSVEDFPGHHFTAGMGTTGEGALNEIEGVQVTPNTDYQVAFEMLKQGQYDGVVCDQAVGQGYVEPMGLRAIEPVLVDEGNLVITKIGNDALVAALDKAITAFMQTEEYTALRAKYEL
jgi:polar amino acid transport system substrate-binding protein